jgi:hypothetical protein
MTAPLTRRAGPLLAPTVHSRNHLHTAGAKFANRRQRNPELRNPLAGRRARIVAARAVASPPASGRTALVPSSTPGVYNASGACSVSPFTTHLVGQRVAPDEIQAAPPATSGSRPTPHMLRHAATRSPTRATTPWRKDFWRDFSEGQMPLSGRQFGGGTLLAPAARIGGVPSGLQRASTMIP